MSNLPSGEPCCSLPIPDGPNDRIHINLKGELRNNGGYKFIVVITDAWTKYAESVPLHNKKAETVAQVIINNWITTFSMPKMIVRNSRTKYLGR